MYWDGGTALQICGSRVQPLRQHRFPFPHQEHKPLLPLHLPQQSWPRFSTGVEPGVGLGTGVGLGVGLGLGLGLGVGLGVGLGLGLGRGVGLGPEPCSLHWYMSRIWSTSPAVSALRLPVSDSLLAGMVSKRLPPG